MKSTCLKTVQFGPARMSLEAINIAYGLENEQSVNEEMENNIKKFANDTVKIFQISEKLKLMHFQAEQGCKGKLIITEQNKCKTHATSNLFFRVQTLCPPMSKMQNPRNFLRSESCCKTPKQKDTMVLSQTNERCSF